MTLLRGILSAYAAGTHTATVRLDGSTVETMAGIPVDRGIPAAQMIVGRKVMLETGESGELNEHVLLAVWT